jgi:antitoxin YefM
MTRIREVTKGRRTDTRRSEVLVSLSKARAGLANLCDDVASTREAVIIRRRGAADVALIAADELRSLLETAHLLRSPRNARRLLAALARARNESLILTPRDWKKFLAALGRTDRPRPRLAAAARRYRRRRAQLAGNEVGNTRDSRSVAHFEARKNAGAKDVTAAISEIRRFRKTLQTGQIELRALIADRRR